MKRKSLELLHYCMNGGLKCDFIYLFLNLDAYSLFPFDVESSDETKKLSYPVSEDLLSDLASKKNYYSFSSKDSEWMNASPEESHQPHNSYKFLVETLKILIVIVLHDEST